MRSMIKNYAIEKAQCDLDDDCKDHKEKNVPTGVFIMNEPTTRAASTEVLCTHKGLCGAAG